ncbi:MAG: DUF1501 domain-containing protein [Planctomycetaceae bacterium]
MHTASDFAAGLTRRGFSQIVAGMGLSFLLPGLSPAAAERRGGDRKKSLITLWMAGGPSQLETWDPHPGTRVGGDTRAIKTSIPGMKIAHLFPRTAEQIHHLSVIRSLTSKEGDHERGTYFVKTGYRPDPTLKHPALGAIFAEQTKKADDNAKQKIEIPRHVSLLKNQWPARGGFLGPQLDAFKVFNPGKEVRNMKAHVGDDRRKRRLQDRELLSRGFARGGFYRVQRTQHEQTLDRALTMMNSNQLKAFLVDDEPQAVRDGYGDTQFGRGCLVARRLVEGGVRAIEVTLRGFDTHANNYTGHETQAAILDPAFAALIHDLKTRDLLKSTVVLCIGEFGRTPQINPLEGRDHWPHFFSCVVGGGGLRSGVLIGETAATTDKQPPKDPVTLPDLYATILKTLGADHAKEYDTPVGRPMAAVNDGEPIKRLLG